MLDTALTLAVSLVPTAVLGYAVWNYRRTVEEIGEKHNRLIDILEAAGRKHHEQSKPMPGHYVKVTDPKVIEQLKDYIENRLDHDVDGVSVEEWKGDGTPDDEEDASFNLPFAAQSLIRFSESNIIATRLIDWCKAHVTAETWQTSPDFDDAEKPRTIYFADMIDAHRCYEKIKRFLRNNKIGFVADDGEIRIDGGGTIEIQDL